MSVILVDQDGVLADWGRGYGLSLDRFGPAAARIPRHADQRSFNLHLDRTPHEIDIIGRVMVEPGFYATLDPIPGAVEALHAMLAAGHDVRVVTSPWVENPSCASDKLDWLWRHLGRAWADRAVITSDKTLVRGDYLIDDKPEVTGSQEPTWEHVLFDQPYNQGLTQRRITNWSEWEQILAG
jgi:5'-nucleotidase